MDGNPKMGAAKTWEQAFPIYSETLVDYSINVEATNSWIKRRTSFLSTALKEAKKKLSSARAQKKKKEMKEMVEKLKSRLKEDSIEITHSSSNMILIQVLCPNCNFILHSELKIDQ